MNKDKNTLHIIALHLAYALEPLKQGTTDLESFRVLMHKIGWDVTNLPASYANLATQVSDLLDATEALSDTAQLDEIIDLVKEIGDVYKALNTLPEAPTGVDPQVFLGEIGERLFEFLLVQYLALELPVLYDLLEILGILQHEEYEATNTRPAFIRSKICYERIPEILADPLSPPSFVYGWGTEELNYDLIAEHLIELFNVLGLLAALEQPDRELADSYQQGAPDEIEETINSCSRLGIFEAEVGTELHDVGLNILELPAEGSHLPGIIIQPNVPQNIGTEYKVDDNLSLFVRAGTDLASKFGIVLRPDQMEIRYPFQPGAMLPSAGFKASLEYAPDSPTVLLGQANKSRLEIVGGSISLRLDYQKGQLELVLEAAPKGLAIVVSGNDVDGFLRNLFGSIDLRVPIDIGIAWSNRTGFNFTGGVGVEVTVYPHLELGPITIERLDIEVGSDFGAGQPPALYTSCAVTFSGAIGPVSFAVEGIGLALDFVFEEGNAGPFDVGFRVLPPLGFGVGIDAGPIAGGGFVAFDPAHARYAGILHLEIFTIAVTAIGLLSTKDTSGQDLPAPGFSFLIIISAEFPPIQLSYGFTLNGVGGLAGIHRTVVTEALQTGLREGAVDHILFPDDPIRNAPQIISDLRAIFPPQANRYVFGPMAILGWGTPTLIAIEMGIIIELPPPIRIVLLGQVNVALPTEEVAIVSLHIDILGIIDFEKQLISIDSTLRDSYVAAFIVTGDMAMRLKLGARPNFALSIGGLNPHFQPPPNFPALQRVAIALGLGDNPRISLQAYMAVTSNSIQFGAQAEIYAAAAGFNIYGWVAFHALLIFSPFSFRIDFSAGFALREGRTRIAGIHVEAMLTGPSPYHARGEGCLSILFFDVCVGFDATFGQRRRAELPKKDPWDELKVALEDQRNWSGRLPGTVIAAIHLKAPPAGADGKVPVLINPSANAEGRQTVIPLNKTLERFGECDLAGPNRYQISRVTLGDAPTSAWSPVRDYMPPSLSENLSESEKLSKDSFQLEIVGVLVGSDDVQKGGARMTEVEYETLIVDSTWESRHQDRYKMPRAQQLALTATGAKAFSGLSNTGHRKFATDPAMAKGVVIEEESFVIATSTDLTQREEFGTHLTKGAALQALKAHLTEHPEDLDQLQVVSAPELEEAA